MLETDAEVMSNTKLTELLATEPPEVRAEVVRINTESRPISLQVALLVPLLAGLHRSRQRVPDAPAPGPGAQCGGGGDTGGLRRNTSRPHKVESSVLKFWTRPLDTIHP